MLKSNNGIAGASVVWIVSYIFFLFSLSNNFSASHDSINYLNHIVKGDELFHQHHLLYHFVASGWLQLWSTVFSGLPAHYIVEAFTALWGSGILAICFLFFRNRFGLTGPLSIAGISVIAFSYGTWFYSVNVEVYTAPIFFMVTALYVMTQKKANSAGVAFIALLHSCAILFHQLNILFVPVVLWWMWSNRSSMVLGRSLALYAVICLVLAGGIYFYVGWFEEGKNSMALFSDWVLGYTKSSHGYWQPLSVTTPLQVMAGFARVFVGAHFIFQLPPINQLLQSTFSSHHLHDEVFLSQNISTTMAWVLTALTLCFATLLVVIVVRFVVSFRRMKLHSNIVQLLLGTFIVYSTFFVFWEPEIPDFWIFQMILIWLMLVGMLPVYRFPFRLSNTTGVAILSVLLLVINYTGSIKLVKNGDNDWYYQEVKKVNPGKKDLVIVEDQWILKDYVRYFTQATVIATDEQKMTKHEISEAVRRTKEAGGKILLYQEEWKIIQSY